MMSIHLILVACVFVALCINVGRGDFPLSVGQVMVILTGGGTDAERFIVMDLRLPRSLVGLAVGAALGLAGALSQAVSRNALATPDILGITAGASAAAVALIVLGAGSLGGVAGLIGLPLAAMLGGLLTAAAIYALAWRNGVDGFRLVLVGIAANAMLTAVTGWLLVSADINDVSRAQIWLTGSLNAAGWDQLSPVTAVLCTVGVAAAISSFALGALRFGDDTARALGVCVPAHQGRALLAAVVLAATATAAAGPIGFVALAGPQIAVRLLRTPGPPLLGSALCGGLLVLASDVVARTILPVELPVGIITSAVGGPFLLYLLVRSNRKVSA